MVLAETAALLTMSNDLRQFTRGEIGALAARAAESFASRVGGDAPPAIAIAPGRVNLIGEHTDYNDGFVTPMALQLGVAVAARPRADRRVRFHSSTSGDMREFDLDALPPPGRHGWVTYVAGVAWALEGAGHHLCGLDAVIEGDLPSGVGLSSSAALEVAVARAWLHAAGLAWDAVACAHICRRAENEFVGVACGIMDQFAATCSREGRAMLLDCRSLETTFVRLPDSVSVIVFDTGVRRSLASSAYNERRASCDLAMDALRRTRPALVALRDVDAAMLDEARPLLDDVTWRRAAHVVGEMGRPAAFAAALERGDLAAAGALMDASHASLRDMYEVSCPELDRAAELARADTHCWGARMTGAGFGGCIVALVERAHAAAFAESLRSRYAREVRPDGRALVCSASAGVHIAG